MSSSAGLISGVEVSKVVRERVAAETAHIKAAEFSGHTAPRLDVIIVGGRKDSATYVRMKAKACEEVGFGHETHTLPETISQADLEAFVADLNANPSVNGILLQLPLPDHLHSPSVIERIAPTKDVDGLNPVNSGLLIRDGIAAPLVPCTPLGCVELLKHYKVPVAGKHAVVVGRSILVGKPIALLLQVRSHLFALSLRRS
jgi:5,10-methylene-tetrahydrofolate dehydrogenase/methenyl tetrahydrofolate cyclohydrolase